MIVGEGVGVVVVGEVVMLLGVGVQIEFELIGRRGGTVYHNAIYRVELNVVV